MECPTCGKRLSNERGMRQHHTKVHGNPLPNRTCKGCDVEFYDPKSRRSYCDDCNPNADEHNGNWSSAKKTTTCKLCDSTFSYYPSDKPGVYCPSCVEAATGLLPESYPERGERRIVSCEGCGVDLEVRPRRAERRKRGCFCSRDCYGDWLSRNIVGPAHHQWDGGPINYGQPWWRIRQQALERDDFTCQQCGVDADELGRNPDVHHLEPVRSFENPTDAHTIENVVTLCRPCHRRVEAGTAVSKK